MVTLRRMVPALAVFALAAGSALAQSVPLPRAEVDKAKAIIEADFAIGSLTVDGPDDDESVTIWGGDIQGQYGVTDQLAILALIGYITGNDDDFEFDMWTFGVGGQFEILQPAKGNVSLSPFVLVGLRLATVEIDPDDEDETAFFFAGGLQAGFKLGDKVMLQPFFAVDHTPWDDILEDPVTMVNFGLKGMYLISNGLFIKAGFIFGFDNDIKSYWLFIVGVQKELESA